MACYQLTLGSLQCMSAHEIPYLDPMTNGLNSLNQGMEKSSVKEGLGSKTLSPFPTVALGRSQINL